MPNTFEQNNRSKSNPKNYEKEKQVPDDLPFVENDESENEESKKEEVSIKKESEETESQKEETSLEKLIKAEEVSNEASDFMRRSTEDFTEIRNSTASIKDVLKLFLPLASVFLFLILLLVFLIYRANKAILKDLEFLRREDLGQRSGIITDKSNGSIEVAVFDAASQDKKKLKFKLDNFSEFSEVNLNFCYVWKEHKEEMARIMPKRPWYPTLLLYVLQWTSMSPSIYPPFPCDRQQIADRGMIFEKKIGFGEIKKNDYVIVRAKRKGNDLHIAKAWKIEPTFLMPLLTDKQ